MERRDFLMTGTLALGLSPAVGSLASAKAAKAMPASLKGPYLDLTTGKGNMLAMARIDANLDETKVKYGSATGVVAGVRDGEPLRDMFGFEVVSAGRAWKQPDGSFRILHRETVLYTDLRSGDVLTEYLNPYNNEKVRVVDVVNDPWNEYIEEFKPRPPSYGGMNKNTDVPREPLILPWREVAGGLVSMERHIHLYYPAALTPEKWPRESAGKMNRVSEYFTYCLSLADLQNPKKTTIEHSGTWVRVTPWLPWLLMGQAPGHCLYHSTVNSFNEIDGFKPNILSYMQKTHPEMLEPPPEESWSKPNLSSLEVYARDQNPAPIKQ
jgi:hypothetical protein